MDKYPDRFINPIKLSETDWKPYKEVPLEDGGWANYCKDDDGQVYVLITDKNDFITWEYYE